MSVAAIQPGHTALITGGASGVGLALAHLCHSKGMNLYLVDRDADALDNARGEFSEGNGKITIFVGDVSKTEDWVTIRDEALSQYKTIELLALNAGMAKKCTWGDADTFREILEVNLFGVLNGLNTMVEPIKTAVQQGSTAKPAAIVITGSKQGITNPPGNPSYNASKAAVKTIAEHLSYDLRDVSNLSVHLLVPGFTFTGIIRKAMGTDKKPDAAWEPKQVVDFLYEKMSKGSFYVICPDNEVSEDLDKRRMIWGVQDIVQDRQPLTRWREDWKEKAKQSIDDMNLSK